MSVCIFVPHPPISHKTGDNIDSLSTIYVNLVVQNSIQIKPSEVSAIKCNQYNC